MFPFSMQNAFTGVLDKKRDVELGLADYVQVCVCVCVCV